MAGGGASEESPRRVATARRGRRTVKRRPSEAGEKIGQREAISRRIRCLCVPSGAPSRLSTVPAPSALDGAQDDRASSPSTTKTERRRRREAAVRLISRRLLIFLQFRERFAPDASFRPAVDDVVFVPRRFFMRPVVRTSKMPRFVSRRLVGVGGLVSWCRECLDGATDTRAARRHGNARKQIGRFTAAAAFTSCWFRRSEHDPARPSLPSTRTATPTASYYAQSRTSRTRSCSTKSPGFFPMKSRRIAAKTSERNGRKKADRTRWPKD